MPGITIKRKTGPRSFVCAESITGAQLVEARNAGRVGVAGAGSLKVIGVALSDGNTPESFTSEPVMVGGRPVLNASPDPHRVAVAYGGIEVPVVYAGAAAFGDKLKAAASGQVTPMGAGDDPRACVGTCTEVNGVASTKTGLMRTA